MEAIAGWFAATLGERLSPEAVVFIVSLFPILECRGGLLVASLLHVDMWRAIPLAVLGNLLPMPLLLLFLKRVFALMKRISLLRPLVERLERRAAHKSEALARGEFLGLLLFVGIPLPGTGGWTGAMIASLMEMKQRKALAAILLGVLLATVIMAIVSYGFLGLLIR